MGGAAGKNTGGAAGANTGGGAGASSGGAAGGGAGGTGQGGTGQGGSNAAGSGGSAGGTAGGSGVGGGGSSAGGASGAAGKSGAAGQAGAAAFVHPGVRGNAGQIAFVKAKIAAKAEPWTQAFTSLGKNKYAKTTYKPTPFASVDCGPFNMPANGCVEELDDARAAYAHALLWTYGGNQDNADTAIAIMNAWAKTLKKHTDSNAPLQSAWAASLWPAAAELIRHSNAGWAAKDVAAFEKLLSDVYLPQIDHGSGANGNWELSMIEGSLGIAVFLDDRAVFDKAIDQWRKRVPAYFYLETDGKEPFSPPTGAPKTGTALATFWSNPAKYRDGLSQETCRDFGHTQLGIGGITGAAETAQIQGVSLFAEQSKRLRLGLELHAGYINDHAAGKPPPTDLCKGAVDDEDFITTWEVGYNALHDRLGLDLPQTKKLIEGKRPIGFTLAWAWETLTHAGVGNAGL